MRMASAAKRGSANRKKRPAKLHALARGVGEKKLRALARGMGERENFTRKDNFTEILCR
jgi:hypothetical protein